MLSVFSYSFWFLNVSTTDTILYQFSDISTLIRLGVSRTLVWNLMLNNHQDRFSVIFIPL